MLSAKIGTLNVRASGRDLRLKAAVVAADESRRARECCRKQWRKLKLRAADANKQWKASARDCEAANIRRNEEPQRRNA